MRMVLLSLCALSLNFGHVVCAEEPVVLAEQEIRIPLTKCTEELGAGVPQEKIDYWLLLNPWMNYLQKNLWSFWRSTDAGLFLSLTRSNKFVFPDNYSVTRDGETMTVSFTLQAVQPVVISKEVSLKEIEFKATLRNLSRGAVECVEEFIGSFEQTDGQTTYVIRRSWLGKKEFENQEIDVHQDPETFQVEPGYDNWIRVIFFSRSPSVK